MGMSVATSVSANPATRFVSESGYQPVDADTVWQQVNNALRAKADSLFQPGAELGPIPLSVVALDALEPALERTRYRVRYGINWVAPPEGSAGGPVPVSYVEVARFNIGPAIREGLIDSLGKENVANAEAFGVGPNTSWRFVTQPVMGNRAMIMSAGRTEIDDQAAQNEMCLGSPCMGVASVIDNAAPWSDMQPVETWPDTPLVTGSQQMVSPVIAINQLLGEVDSIETDSPAGAPAQPDWSIEAVIESNLGQDLGIEAAYRWGNLLDDSIGTLWQRLATFGMGGDQPAAFRAEAFECNRGPAFAAPGEYCP
ncbi:hypothetical protein DBV39_10970 [Orrella marina]|uniref:Uncharacterized protein n=2 Tax=Orrella marina TaxID=2163011 RepID=A0A2R4XK05_9BURK|nr:hypothetical protein DBV39_10970 [Orrella marina]